MRQYSNRNNNQDIEMIGKITKWFIFTVLVGLIPVFVRLLIKFNTVNVIHDSYNSSDFISLGLVLHISIFNEIEHLDSANNKNWKSIMNGLSILFIILYSALFAALLFASSNPLIVDNSSMLRSSLALVTASLLISFAVFYHLSNAQKQGEI